MDARENGSGARVARLTIFPVKSLDGQQVETATMLPSGALEHDRAYSLHDAEGQAVNAKRYPALQRLRTTIDLESRSISIEGADRSVIDLATGRDRFEAQLAALIGVAVSLRENRTTGFPDDLASPGPTLISTATLEELGDWFELDVDDMRARLRANIEIEGVPPFWEDRLFGDHEDKTVAFHLGDVALLGINPCLRCAVPTRDPRTGTPDPDFVARFAAQREKTLPSWAPRGRFRPLYRVAVNTRRNLSLAGAAAVIRVGDPVSLD